MSKIDGKVYVIIYEVRGHKFHSPYVYKTAQGVTDQVIAFKDKEWYATNIKVLVIGKEDKSDDGEYYVLKETTGKHKLIKVNDSSKVLFEEF